MQRRFERSSLYVAGLEVHKEREKSHEKLEGRYDDRMGMADRYVFVDLADGLR